MTHPALTPEQRAARIERAIAACIAELEQLLADLDSKQVTPRQLRCLKGCKEVDDECDAAGHPIADDSQLTPRQIERVQSAHESNSKAWDLTQEAAKLDTAELSQEQIVRYPVLSHDPHRIMSTAEASP